MMLSHMRRSCQLVGGFNSSATAAAAQAVLNCGSSSSRRHTSTLPSNFANKPHFSEDNERAGFSAHTDLTSPDLNDYRRMSTLDPTKTTNEESRKLFTYVITGTALSATIVLAKDTVRGVVRIFAPNKNVLEVANIELDISDIPEGKSLMVQWLGKPLFIKHRTDAEMEEQLAVDTSSFRDPVPDSIRFPDPKWQVLIGVCTHLGCIPIEGKGDFGGYYCPCHGSHYDIAGRIRKGPAPLNLEVPPYRIKGDLMIIGS